MGSGEARSSNGVVEDWNREIDDPCSMPWSGREVEGGIPERGPIPGARPDRDPHDSSAFAERTRYSWITELAGQDQLELGSLSQRTRRIDPPSHASGFPLSLL